MIDKKHVKQFDEIFPEVKSIKLSTREETIALAHRVATALKKERATLAKEEQENTITSRFFYTST